MKKKKFSKILEFFFDFFKIFLIKILEVDHLYAWTCGKILTILVQKRLKYVVSSIFTLYLTFLNKKKFLKIFDFFRFFDFFRNFKNFIKILRLWRLLSFRRCITPRINSIWTDMVLIHCGHVVETLSMKKLSWNSSFTVNSFRFGGHAKNELSALFCCYAQYFLFC